jgi:hypothetical protein
MKFDELSEFLGSRLLLLMPDLRENFKDEIQAWVNSEAGRMEKP